MPLDRAAPRPTERVVLNIAWTSLGVDQLAFCGFWKILTYFITKIDTQLLAIGKKQILKHSY